MSATSVVLPPPTGVRRNRIRFDASIALPAARGPVSERLLALLVREPSATVPADALGWAPGNSDATTDDDLQLALWLVYEQHYRGLAGVDDGWEWHPDLLRVRRGWEEHFVAALRRHCPPTLDDVADRAAVVERLNALAGAEDSRSLSKFLMRDAGSAQFAEFLVHRSIYHLKEADPHTWGIPRLSGSIKGAMVTIQTDEYGGGATEMMHAQLFRELMLDWNLDARYGYYLDDVPGRTLMATNLITMFGLHRRWRGALVGHLAMFEMTSAVPNGRYARGHRRLGGADEAALFFDEHVVADSVHDQIALHQLAGALAVVEPQLSSDIVFGAECAAYADRVLADHLFDRWDAGRTSLRHPLEGFPR